MKLGVAIPQRMWPSQEERSFAEAVDFAVRAEALGFDTVWASDHYFLGFGGPRLSVGPEPMTLLSFIAGRTARIGLGTMVLCAPLRPPGALVREATALADLSGGRFTLGLGAGWHQPEFEAFAIPTDRLYSRFEEYVEVVGALLTGEPVDHEGTYFALRAGQVLGGARPRLLVAAAGPRMIALAARTADAWSLPGSYEHLGARLAQLRHAEAAAGRPAGTVTSGCGAAALLVSAEEGNELLAANPPPTPVAVGSEQLRSLVDGLAAEGCDEVVLHFSGAVWTGYRDDQLDLAAAALDMGA
ncbi:MAG TPA: LLM class flavin-dependent oxidoreductase [Acidimicrobiia bacterium]|jgi:alkanesulfonate monooxygenase SsuD/methylene tetrahydromethanopterin reductase-like flavin-dependent oxidoreductase (luciferase family)